MRHATVPWFRVLLVTLAAGTLLPALLAENVPDGKALITVRLPAKAVLTIDEAVTKATGAERAFISPALERGKLFAYTLVATWDDNGEKKTVTRKIWVKAGEHKQIDLNAAEVVEKKEPAKKAPEPEVAKEPTAGPIKSRSFLFTYAATVTGLKPEQKVRLWLPVPPSNEDQDAKLVDDKGLPEGYKLGKDAEYGNQILYIEAEADKDGKVPVSVVYRVTRREVRGDSRAEKPTAEEVKRFLEADALVPIDGKPLDLIKDKKLPADQTAAARVLYDTVDRHMKYDKPAGKPWGRGDSVYACESGVGNCTDFHSLFISLARSQKIPAKFEMGFSLPEKHGAGDVLGYHCWAKFQPKGKGWIPVDISEANKHPNLKEYYFGNLTEDRVAFSTGRDVTLEPKQDGAPLNYFIYPYAEVDGKAYPADKIQRKFSFKDEPAEEK